VSTAPQSPQQPEPAASTTRDEVRVRRAPKYPVFIFGGIVVGIVVTFIAVLVAPGAGDTPFLQAFGYFVLYGIAIGALFGAIVAVVLDAIANRRARSVQTERTTVENPESTDPDSTDPVEGELE
jgi:ABC-type Fe3+-siderophore transport system permease subunit